MPAHCHAVTEVLQFEDSRGGPAPPIETMTTAILTASDALAAAVTCPFCSGSGKLPHFSHIANGDCFACGASGELRDLTAFVGSNSDMMLTVFLHRGEFSCATLRRRTWKNTREGGMLWGRDSFYREINDAEEAREIWRNAKRLGITTEMGD